MSDDHQRGPSLKAIMSDGAAMVVWLTMVRDAFKVFPTGFFHKEFIEWQASLGAEYDGRVLDPADQDMMDDYIPNMIGVFDSFTAWKIVQVNYERPERVYKASGLKLLPEPVTRPGPKLLGLSELPVWRQVLFFRRKLLTRYAAKQFGKLRAPIAVASAAFAILKLVFQWNSISASAAAAIAAALAAIAVAIAPN